MIDRLVLIIFCTALFLPLSPAATSAAPESNRTGHVVFDLSHGEIFSPFTERPLDYSSFRTMIADAGFTVSGRKQPLDEQSLEGVDGYILAGPSRSVEGREIEILKSFVSRGGHLIVLLHIAPPVARLTESFGILVSNFVLSESENVIAGQSQDFLVTRFSGHPVTRGLSGVALHGSWALMAESPAAAIAETSPEAWFDLNRNRQWDRDEPKASSAIMVVSRLGKGEVLVVADDAPFANRFLDEAQNRRLAENIIHWLK